VRGKRDRKGAEGERKKLEPAEKRRTTRGRTSNYAAEYIGMISGGWSAKEQGRTKKKRSTTTKEGRGKKSMGRREMQTERDHIRLLPRRRETKTLARVCTPKQRVN